MASSSGTVALSSISTWSIVALMSVSVDRRVSGSRLRVLLGTWQHHGPAYQALADALRGLVRAGTLPLATRLPGEREVADALGVSRTTVTAAYDLLRDEGFLASRRGSGTVTTLPPHAGDRVPTRLGGVDDGLVDLSAAAPSAPPQLAAACAAALDALPRHTTGTGYTPLGLPALRAAVAERYTRRGTPTTPEQVLVTTGGQQAIHLLTSAYAGPGDRVVVEHPTYPHAIDAVRAAGARAVPVPVTPHGTDLELLASTVHQAAPRLVYLVPDHHNPTGTSLTTDARARVRDLARRTRTVVVGDETLTDLTLSGPEPEPFAGAGPADRYVVCVGSASKTFWGGLRVGWLRGHPDVVAALAQRRAHVDIGTSVLDQLVTLELLAHADEVVAQRRATVRAQRDALHSMLAQELPEWRTTVPAGGLSTWVDLTRPVSTALAALAHGHGVRVAPGPAFGVDGTFDDHLRIPFAQPADALRRAVDGLAAAWAVLGGATPQHGLRAQPALV
ncbi:transcriptional regulator, GntR family with aminotransferase domain [Cellulomonas flavigena DSM 20109]|uniref:Transcriptional regulator, GntR family with aminotransferase domain n=2 Tax=Cellulomonas flavigena TaxID=1711 RepID=D5UFW5_CELFN|nr:transcriptional regulator, GntR family with aminotransferase domain [Cellulomonas flavigena DSM 20109]